MVSLTRHAIAQQAPDHLYCPLIPRFLPLYPCGIQITVDAMKSFTLQAIPTYLNTLQQLIKSAAVVDMENVPHIVPPQSNIALLPVTKSQSVAVSAEPFS